MSVRPVRLNLPKIRREDLRREATIRHFFPSPKIQDAVHAAIRSALMSQLGPEVRLFLESVQSQPFGELLDQSADASVMVQLTVQPHNAKAFLQIDHELAALIVNRLLGGEGGREVEPVPLTETEQGILQYLVMKACAAMHKATGQTAAYHFRFDKIAAHIDVFEKFFTPTETVVITTWRLGLGERIGFVRVYLPQSLLESVATKHAQEKPMPSRARASTYGYEQVEVWADGGHCELTPQDIAGLEVGDVVLLDRTTLALPGGQVDGEVILRVGKGTSSGIRCAIDAKKRSRCIVKDIE